MRAGWRGHHLRSRSQRLLPAAEPERASRQTRPGRKRVTEPAQRDRLCLLGGQVIEPADRAGEPAQQVRFALPAPAVDYGDPQPRQRREREIGQVRPLRVTIEDVRRLVQGADIQRSLLSSTAVILSVVELEAAATFWPGGWACGRRPAWSAMSS